MRLALLVALIATACSPIPPAASQIEGTSAWPPVRFRLPLADPNVISPDVVGVDHDPVDHSDDGLLAEARCTNYSGDAFPSCYDEHDGSDFLLVNGFATMDAGSTQILAAADGVVLGLEEGQYDRCHAVTDGISCDGHPIEANYVILDHGDGIETLYWHVKTDSVTVEVGDEVRCGDVIAVVGSSGISSTPHLHFEVQVDGAPLDPFAGPFSQSTSWWIDQQVAPVLPGEQCAPS